MNPQPYLSENGVLIFNKLAELYPDSDSYELSMLAHSYDQYQYFSDKLEEEKLNPQMKIIDLSRITGMINTYYKQAVASQKAVSKNKAEEIESLFEV